MDQSFIIIDAKDGNEIAEIDMGSADSGKESVLKTHFDKKKNEIMLIGEFYKPGDDVLKDKSQGLFLKQVTPSGEVIETTKFKWKGDVNKFKNASLSAEDKKDAKDALYMFFHDVIRGENGYLFLIAEQFKKQVSAGGVAMNILAAASGGSSDAASFEVRVKNMVVIEFDETNQLIDFKVIKKKYTSVFLPQGAGLWNTAFLGHYVNGIGGFDYSFTSADKENDNYTIVYTHYNRKVKKGEKKSDKMLGIIQIEGGKLEASRVPINTEAKRWWMLPAKPGYISIIEYYRKEIGYAFRTSDVLRQNQDIKKLQ